jgi:hypothetical protein
MRRSLSLRAYAFLVHTGNHVNFGLIEKLKAEGIATASFHLDRYWGPDQLDRRESLIGQHPFWHTDRLAEVMVDSVARAVDVGLRSLASELEEVRQRLGL